MNYQSALDYSNSFIDFEKIPRYNYASSFRLERMHAFLQELGNPHDKLNAIHVAGSKGKGSTCAMVASVLKEAGYRVGLYTSPHLVDTRERIRVSDEIIKEDEFVWLIERIRPAAEKLRDHSELGKLSFFEILTAAAFLYFKEKEVDFAVLETGLGGRLDATNVAEPVVCGITSISMEHMDKLGNTLREIAKEKAGIIKSRCSVFAVKQQKKVIDVIREACREKHAKLHEVSRELPYENLDMSLLGRHQLENAGLAIAMVKFLDSKVDEKTIRSGLKNVDWPGRMQVVQKEPYVILDGAQNVASIKAVLSSIKTIFRYNNLISVFGISGDKDIEGVARELNKASDTLILTRSKNERAAAPVHLKEYFSRPDARIISNVKDALIAGLEIAGKEDLVLVTGSLYVVGDAMKSYPALLKCKARCCGRHYENG